MQTETVEIHKLKNYYWSILSKASMIEQNLKDHMTQTTPELDTIKALAATGLIRCGVEFKKKYSQSVDVQETTHKVGFLTLTSKQETDLPQELSLILQDDLKRNYTISGEAVKRVLGSDYKKLILDDDGANRNFNPANRIKAIDLPDLDFSDLDDNDTAAKSPADQKVIEAANKKKEEENKLADENRLPVFASDPHFPSDKPDQKDGWTFLYNRHIVKIPLKQGVVIVKFYVYPLDVKQNDPATDIFVTAESGGMVRAGVSRGTTTGVSIEFDDVKFMIRAAWKNGEFQSIVRCLNQELAGTIAAQETKSFTPDPRMASTYFKTTVDGVPIDVFPAKFGENERTGYALAAVAIESKNNIGIATPGPDGTCILDLGNGSSKYLDCYWIGSKTVSFKVETFD